mgnify:CR=1 FL=1
MGVATPQSQEKWVEDNLERGAQSEPEVVEFTVYDRKDSAPVGTAGLLGILHAHGNAEFAIFLGERRGQGGLGDRPGRASNAPQRLSQARDHPEPRLRAARDIDECSLSSHVGAKRIATRSKALTLGCCESTSEL